MKVLQAFRGSSKGNSLIFNLRKRNQIRESVLEAGRKVEQRGDIKKHIIFPKEGQIYIALA